MPPHPNRENLDLMGLAAANANLKDSDQVNNGRRLNRETKDFLASELAKIGLKYIPSEANFVMIDVERPVFPMIGALRQRGVQVGRLFPALPNYMRVTVGKRSEMETFLEVFRSIIA